VAFARVAEAPSSQSLTFKRIENDVSGGSCQPHYGGCRARRRPRILRLRQQHFDSCLVLINASVRCSFSHHSGPV